MQIACGMRQAAAVIEVGQPRRPPHTQTNTLSTHTCATSCTDTLNSLQIHLYLRVLGTWLLAACCCCSCRSCFIYISISIWYFVCICYHAGPENIVIIIIKSRKSHEKKQEKKKRLRLPWQLGSRLECWPPRNLNMISTELLSIYCLCYYRLNSSQQKKIGLFSLSPILKGDYESAYDQIAYCDPVKGLPTHRSWLNDKIANLGGRSSIT